jgi:hypothetical protein
MYVSQLSQLLPLYYRHGFHSRLADLNRLLRYILGGQRPTETAHQVLSLESVAPEVRKYRNKGWYFTVESTPTEISASTSSTYATHCTRIPNTKLQ